MSLIRPGNILTLCLAGTALVAAGTVGVLLMSQGSTPDLSDHVSIPPPLPEANVEDIVLDPPPMEQYAEIGERPLFNPDRLPKPRGGDIVVQECEDPNDPACCQDPDDPTCGEIVIKELNVRVTGVIITPEKQFVMYTDRDSKESSSAEIGQPLEGNQVGWRVDSVNSRDVVFVEEVNGRSETHELETHTQTLGGSNAGGVKRSPAVATANQAATQNAGTEPAGEETQADEVRRRIAERRARMRAEAARKQAEMREQQEQADQNGNDKDGGRRN